MHIGLRFAARAYVLVVRVHNEVTGQWDMFAEHKTMQETVRNKSSMTAEQRQLPVFKAAELQGTPAEYQKKASTYQSEVQKSTVREAKPVLRYETQDGTPVGTKPRSQQQQGKPLSFRPPQPMGAVDPQPQQALPAGSKSQQALPLEAKPKALPSPTTSVRREVGACTALHTASQKLSSSHCGLSSFVGGPAC